MKFSTRLFRYIKTVPISTMIKDSFFIPFPELSWWVNKKYLRSVVSYCKKKNKPFILELGYGGLGDHLVFSALPEFFSKKLGVKFQISSKSLFLQNDIKKIVWELNPYVKFTNKHGMRLSCPIVSRFKNYNDAFADIFGMKKNDQAIKMYYHPERIVTGRNEVLCDLTFGPSGEYNGYTEEIFINNVIDYLRKNYSDKVLVLLLPKTNYANKSIVQAIQESNLKFNIQSIDSIFQLANFLHSYPERVLLYSGAASLAASMNCSATVLCNKLSNPHFQYATNNYVMLVNKN